MAKGRKPAEVPVGTEVVVREGVLEDGAKATTEIAIGQQMVMDAADVLMAAGRIQAAHFVETVSSRLIAETYVQIKESKAYKGLPYKTATGETGNISTLDEFCEMYMPRSRRRCEQIAENYHLLGPELYEQAEAIGFRQRDYNALKALPADDQAIVKQAIDAGKFENAIELMQDMAVKHVKEKEALQKEASDAKANYQALDKVEKQTRERLSDLERKQALTDPWDAKVLGATDELSQLGTVADEVLGKHVAFLDLCESLADQLDPDAEDHGARLEQVRVPINRLGEQLDRFAHLVARMQFEFLNRLSMYQDNTHTLDAAEE